MNTKQKVLKELESHKDTPLSGAALAESIGVSRTAIWKAINGLKEDGHKITATTNKGYTLAATSDILSTESVLPHLRHRVPVVVRTTVDSTNKVAAAMALEEAIHGTTVIASEQTAGRGRRGRSFYSPKDTGLYMSIIIEPTFDVSKTVLVTAAIAVAVSKAIDEITGLSSSIKWVNDVYIEDKKVCGILTEAISDFETGQIHRIVVGVGINCRTEDFPPDAGANPGSLGGNVPRGKLAAKIINNFLDIVDSIENRQFITEYRNRSMLLGKEINIFPSMDAPPEAATALDINQDGELIVEMIHGEKRTLSTGEVSIRLR